MIIRRATKDDLPAVLALEEVAFQPDRRASMASLRRSLVSPRQSFWLAVEDEVVGLLVLWHHSKTLRVYDIAVHPRRKGTGVGRALMAHAEGLAKKGKQRVSLEADPQEQGLVAWYEKQGYSITAHLADYYDGRPAVRMQKVP